MFFSRISPDAIFPNFSLMKLGWDRSYFACENATMFLICQKEDDVEAGGNPREINFPKLLGALEKLFPDPVD